MKKVIVTALIGLTMVGFTGCTSISDTISDTMNDAKSSVTSKVEGAKDAAIKDATKGMKCAASGKCGK